MKAVVQRCRSASVTVDGQVISSIQRGLMVLVGIGTNDTAHESQWLVSKLLNLRLFPEGESDEWGWKKSVMDISGEILSGVNGHTSFESSAREVTSTDSSHSYTSATLWRSTWNPKVSQFTLMANTKKGSKPDFHGAMAASQSKAMYDTFSADLRAKYQDDKIKDGRVGLLFSSFGTSPVSTSTPVMTDKVSQSSILQFGAMVDVQLINDGPATIILDSIDAPAPVIPKPFLTPEQKRLRKEQFAKEEAEKKAAAQERRTATADEASTDEKLTQRLKESMMENY